MVKRAIVQVKEQISKLSEEDKKIIEYAELYLKDSQYYLDKGDYATALATISYAEGLLDSLNITGKLVINWIREKPKKVLVAGTFDLLHPGHILFFQEASKLGDLYVIVARDVNSEKAKRRPVIIPENSRVFLVESIRHVRKALLGDRDDILKRVVEISPDIIVLGPDQSIDERWLREELRRRGLTNTKVIRLSGRLNALYPSSSREIIEKVKELFCLGKVS